MQNYREQKDYRAEAAIEHRERKRPLRPHKVWNTYTTLIMMITTTICKLEDSKNTNLNFEQKLIYFITIKSDPVYNKIHVNTCCPNDRGCK